VATINGTSGDDTLNGTDGDDTINGLGGNDSLAGGSGVDTIDGGDGDDILFSDSPSPAPWNLYTPPALDHGTAVDTITGGDGSDFIFAGYGDNVDGGADGYYGDKLFISFQAAPSGLTFDGHLAAQTIGGGTITGVENISWVEGSNYDDYIDVGTNTNNGYSDFTVVHGMGGNDTLIAGYYTSVLDGGDGDDIVDGRNSQYLDEVDGDAGNDTLYTNANTFAVANGGGGNDTIYAHGEIHGGAGDDTIHVVDSYYPGPVTGEDGNDTIYGSDHADHIDGGAGNDTIDGGGGDDILISGVGEDDLTGGAGNDQFFVGDGNDVITDFSASDGLHIQAGFSADSVQQAGSDVVIALSNGDQLTIQNSDVATIKAALQSSVSLNDIAISPDGSTIYGAGDDGNLYIYDAATGEFVKAWHIGTELGGMDISPDGRFAIVTELQPVESHYADPWWDSQFGAAVYKVDLATGQVTTYTTTLAGDEYAFYDASILDNGQVLLTEQILPGWSGWAPMRTLDLSSGKFAVASEIITQNSVLTDGGDGSGALVGEANISDARMDIYAAGRGVTSVHQNYADGVQGFNHGVQAYSATAGIVAQSVGSEIYIYNGQLQYQLDLGQLHPELSAGGVGGLTFDPSGRYLFVLNVQDDAIYQVSTSDWSIVNTIAVGVDITTTDGKFGDRLLAAPDMSYFIVATDTGFVRVAMPSNETATSGADFLLGTSGDDTIDGLAGNDAIYGSAGNDTLSGGDGNDTLSGRTGSDTLTGGAGNDTFLYGQGDGADVIMDFAPGDLVNVSAYQTAQSMMQVGADVIVIFSGGDQITFHNTTLSVVQAGLHFVDVQPPMNLAGTAGNDTLTGGSGNDALNGGAGNDTLDGRGGADTMIGGTGNDVFYVDNAGDVVTEARRGGTDEIRASVSYALVTGVQVEKMTAIGTGAVNLTGNELAQTLQGNTADNFLYGMGGNDKLNGGDGNDTLRGGLGTDTLTGGAGADLFVFEAKGGNDRITDFVSGTDKIDLHLLGTDSSAVHTAVNRAGDLVISVDADHNGRADFTITLTHVTHVDTGDFIFG
jgi:Ca2+-binding RTX toxin-like protein